ncbi:MAG TPA: quinone-interacting membrane-bound oxidoreductase complex subunit QmoC [Solirubrobacteraceae bacterium]|jgi:quinone-modifying oxidoreductase subunit QmoC|nr:quinone-interacting membrane-bound oxidoreductase complex subunit QmoC [Solirubrobacteraceae bacterium]
MTVERSDPLVVEQLLELGGDHLRNCYQCGTCSVVCPRTPLDAAFPRKEMAWAQWGLQDKLVADADAWLCYQCNECIVACPVDARPGDVMAAVRNFQISSYAVPQFMAKVSQGPRHLALAFALPIVFVGILLTLAIGLGDGQFTPDGDVLFEKMVPHVYLDAVTLTLLAFVFALAGVSGRRFWRAITAADDPGAQQRAFWPSLRSALVDVLTHRDFKDCKQNRRRAYAHMAIFYGFLMLVAATTGAFVYTVVFKALGIHWQDNELSLPLWDPVKIIGNLGFVLLLGGGIWATAHHRRNREEAGGAGYFDWFFVAMIYLTALTGFGLMLLRLINVPEIAYPFYAVHLVFVYALFAYFPYSKFSHVLYRTLANTHAKQIGRRAGAYTGEAVEAPVAGNGMPAAEPRVPAS